VNKIGNQIKESVALNLR